MSQNFNITMKQYNGTDYDVLYPATVDGQVGLSSEAQDYYPSGYGLEDVLVQNAQRTEAIGTVRITARNDLDNSWVPCDRRVFSNEEYPELANIVVPSVSSTFTQKNINLPEKPNNSDVLYSYCNNQHIFMYYYTDGKDHIAITDSLENPSWETKITNLHSGKPSAWKIIYLENNNMYLMIPAYGQISLAFKSIDLITWTPISGGGPVSNNGAMAYSTSDNAIYMLTQKYESSSYTTYLYKTTDFTNWELLTQKPSSCNNSFGLTVYAANGYVYCTRFINAGGFKNYNDYLIFNAQTNEEVSYGTASEDSCYYYAGNENIGIRIYGTTSSFSIGNITGINFSTFIPGTSTFSTPVNFSTINMDTSAPISIMNLGNNYMIYNGYCLSVVNKNNESIEYKNNAPLSGGVEYVEFINNTIYLINADYNSQTINIYSSTLSLPDIKLDTNAIAYIKATQTPSN